MTTQELLELLRKAREPKQFSPQEELDIAPTAAPTGDVMADAIRQAPLPRTSPLIPPDTPQPSDVQLQQAAMDAPIPRVLPEQRGGGIDISRAPVNLPAAPQTSLDPRSRDARIQQLEDILMSKMTEKQPWWQGGLSGIAIGAGARTPEEGSVMVARGMQLQQQRRQQDIVDQINAIKALQSGKAQDELTKYRKGLSGLVPYTTDEGETIMVPQSGIPGLIRGQEANRASIERTKIQGLRPGMPKSTGDVLSATDAQKHAASGYKFKNLNGDDIDVTALGPNQELRLIMTNNQDSPARWEFGSQRMMTNTMNNVRTVSPARNPEIPLAQGVANVGTVGSHEEMVFNPATNSQAAQQMYSTSSPAMTGQIIAPPPGGAQPMPVPQQPAVQPQQAPQAPLAIQQQARPAPSIAPAPQMPSVAPSQPVPSPTVRPPVAAVPQRTVAPPAGGGGVRNLNTFTQEEVRRQSDVMKSIAPAASQIFGDKSVPEFESLTEFAHLADDPAARKRIGTATQIIMQAIDRGESQREGIGAQVGGYGFGLHGGGLLQGVRNVLGVNKWIAQTEIDKVESALIEMTPEERRATNRIISAYGTISSLRTLTRASGLEYSMINLQREVPVFGLSVNSSKDYYDKLAAMATEIASAVKSTKISAGLYPEISEWALKGRALSRLGGSSRVSPGEKVNPFPPGKP